MVWITEGGRAAAPPSPPPLANQYAVYIVTSPYMNNDNVETYTLLQSWTKLCGKNNVTPPQNAHSLINCLCDKKTNFSHSTTQIYVNTSICTFRCYFKFEELVLYTGGLISSPINEANKNCPPK